MQSGESTTSSTSSGVLSAFGGRDLLRARLIAFHRLGFCVSAALVLLMNFILRARYVERWDEVLGCPANLASFAAVLSFAGFWILVGRCDFSLASLRRIDAVGAFFVCMVTVVRGCVPDLMKHTEFTSVLAITNVLVFRAVVIPSRPLRTLWIGIACALPLAGAVLFEHLRDTPPPGFDASFLREYGVLFLMWAGVAVTSSTAASAVIYGLRREVSQARKLGQYTLEEKLGEGAMGEVYRASHALLRRPTAVKLVKPEATSERILKRFEHEVQQTARLTHPNTIAIYDYGHTPDDVFYYAMEFLDGADLETLVEQTGPMPPARVIHVLLQIAASLTEAHGLGLVHRDIKPANVILCERGGMVDTVKVVDFGLVKDVSDAGRLEASHAGLTGTPFYLAPEAIRAPESVDARSDLYALGAVGYFLLCGKVVFEAKSIGEIIGAHLTTSPVPPSVRLGSPLPKDLEQVVLACLAKSPDDRPVSAADLGSRLSACADAGAWTLEDARAWWCHYEGGRPCAEETESVKGSRSVLEVARD